MNAVTQTVSPADAAFKQALRDFVAAGSTEVTPNDEKLLVEMARILPAGFPVYVANTPKTSPDDVVRIALRIQELGLAASPHVIARRVAGERIAHIRTFNFRARAPAANLRAGFFVTVSNE